MVFFDWIDEFVQRQTDRLFHFLMQRFKMPLSRVRSIFIGYLIAIDLAKSLVSEAQENKILDMLGSIAFAFIVGHTFRRSLNVWEKQNEKNKLPNLVESIPEWSEELDEETEEMKRVPTRMRRERYMTLGTCLSWIVLVGSTTELFCHFMGENLHPILFHLFFSQHSVTEQVIIILQCIAWILLFYSRYTPYKKQL